MRFLRSILVALAFLSVVPVPPACCMEEPVDACCGDAPACPVDASGTCVLVAEEAPVVAPEAPVSPSAAAVLAAPFAAFEDRAGAAEAPPPPAAESPPRPPHGIFPLRI